MTSGGTFTIGGKPTKVGKLIGKGGEGAVFALGDDRAVKIYAIPDARREAKITAMIKAGLAHGSDLIAFPSAVARQNNGSFAGFAMRKVQGYTSLHDLYAPGSRKIHFPKADYRFTIRAAANIARAIAKVHELGVVIGDINHSGILISDQAMAALIDADSFQFGPSHLCRVGVAEYTPPELQGQRLERVIRTRNHDAFGLAVVIFQLLFMGRHPLLGRYSGGEMPLERAIAENRFAYSLSRQVGMTPPPGACQLSDFPLYIGQAFEAAFAPSATARPTASQWATSLEEFERSLTRCSANSMHFFPSAGAPCIWCRMEQALGILLFLPTYDFGSGSDFKDPGAAGFNLGAVWAAIEAVRFPDPASFQPALSPVSPTPSEEAKQAKGSQNNQRMIGYLSLAVALVVLFLSPALWPVYGAVAWFGVAKAFGSPGGDTRRFVVKYEQAERAYLAALDSWRTRTGVEEMRALREALREAKAELEQLPQTEKRRLAEHEASRRDRQLHDFLETFQIRRANLRGLGPAKIAALSSYGVDTAADIVRGRVLAVPGFGEATARPLLQWRDKVAARFVYRAQPSATELQELQRIRQSCSSQAASLRAKLSKGRGDLQRATSTLTERLKTADPAIARANEEREQAKADLTLLGLPIPTVRPPAAKVGRKPIYAPVYVPKSKPVRTPGLQTTSGLSCPTCGGRMIRRQARRGRNAGSHFWGCAAFPRCRGTRSI